jgi:uncharacterized membrane protein
MIDVIQDFIKNEELLIFILAALPISEVRGAIPAGLAMGMPLAKVLLISIIGNISFVIPMLFLFEPVSNRLRNLRFWRNFFNWFFERTKRKSDIIQKYEALGLAIFVGIPLPMTGAWTGCVAAGMFKIKFRYAFISIVAGVFMAAAIVTIACLLGKEAFVAGDRCIQAITSP